jgi:hypothetical protein
MNRIHEEVLHLVAIGTLALVSAGCARPMPGTYVGEAVESGTLKLAMAEGPTAQNQRPPRALPKTTVTVVAHGENVTVRFGECALEGQPSGPERVVVTGECPVSFAGYEGPMRLSGTATLVGEAIEVSLTGLEKNPTTVASYSWSFKGARQD